ncbi:hypothetical protein, partial [Vibrio kanaloae]|uniref:hypothetical protein n=1 Tax=Vibrio kanaloae TaxID=170673 RepID=UPI0019D31894
PRVKKENVSGLFLTISLCIVKIDCRCSSLIEVNTQWGISELRFLGTQIFRITSSIASMRTAYMQLAKIPFQTLLHNSS